jgi:membrane-bound lytic murein transglycosylase D
MKLLHVLALGACVWLAGCAAPGTPTTDAPAGATTSTTRPRADMPQAGDMSAVAVTELRSRKVAPLDAPADLWERIRRGFALPDLDTELVQQQQQWYVSRPDYIQRMTERSRLYIFHVVEELELRGMPTELALLPYIESAFNPQAVSSAKAAGMWQFMPATGSSFDLRQNALRDDRFGDWHLALAAYNWGQGNVNRAIERNRAAGQGTGYLDLNMPAETRQYVPKLQAVKNIIAQPDALGAALPLIENHPFFDTVDITRDIDVEVAARLAEVRLEDFKALNPSQHKPVIFAAGTPQVLLPWNNAAVFKQNLTKAPTGSLASWTAWVAPATMPSREAASRVEMDEEEFRRINGIPKGMMIKSGSTLLVPRNGHGPAAVASHVVDNAHVAYTPEVVLRRTTVRARRGDSIATIAARHDLPTATVAGWNQGRASLKSGQAVVLYLPVRASAARAPAARGRAAPAAKHRQAARPAQGRGGAKAAKVAARATPAAKPNASKKR